MGYICFRDTDRTRNKEITLQLIKYPKNRDSPKDDMDRLYFVYIINLYCISIFKKH